MTTSPVRQFLKDHGIQEVEAIIPDLAGVARGKVVPSEKYIEEEGMRLPESIFLQTVTGDYPDDDSSISPSEIDIVLKADPNTIRVVPWAAEPTAQVIHDCFYGDGRPVTMSPAMCCAACSICTRVMAGIRSLRPSSSSIWSSQTLTPTIP